ncbi:Activator of Hsp90 ATPase 1 family protein OS=Tsukamurella paurometabola (strain ATCC 8368 / DSM/ CCUG 35730 / CIP 100753 / JCM 10117 / KCTC 9821 / NBRC 16120 / NCIMB 702349 / NCTC 13040) OX=521096 GN=Tpau_4031 PE=3 SV=1 [Tsukamurella paurometabola]|uniref:Activator of Hsp90 ATPase 1 family protein n=1 Tax=Tsukamurella paurometabola (strain ATCC 8368 / DSM 20162 / CCUG 35730 / CIP 100753 / JCM 10117 / KCTC 9821 / NBRC 16120 / NCIMB 702349 / NCTC 13040) TaxID=521096 RepID=D5UNA7_TSUPD|nr:SRPBCC family protein [Tsukamurella paurometabola]ADG80602.1 Activator of Hsp90 ATPase 1 family protein [Tsukamurella paurometabola DSM 20162]SUP40247.1 Activator of Hsp90 ATPase homolog 1-like protein [Tsukamurella paurometabola]
MTYDIDALAAAAPEAVTRTAEVRDSGEGDVYVSASLSQTYPTDVADLWDAVTNAERLPRWFSAVHGDLELGGRFQVEDNAAGSVLECDAPNRYLVSWEIMGGASKVEVTVAPDGDGARLTLTHFGDNARDFYEQFGPGATGVGWDLSLLGLGAYLITGQDRPEDAEAFFATPTAQAFVKASAAKWADATVAAGVPEEQARAQGERTAAFFSGS